MASRGYYKSQTLPPIRDVLGDQLDRRPHNDAYSVEQMQRALPATTLQSRSRHTWPQISGPKLAPIYSQKYETIPVHEQPSTHIYSSSLGVRKTNSTSASPVAPYSFDVFRPTPKGLVHESSSDHSQGILRTTRVDAGRRQVRPEIYHDHDDELYDAEKKYGCPKCGKRFSRPSSLKTHEVVHSDEKPHECPHPGCGKTFTIPSNMRRHYRKAHEGGGGSGEDDPDDKYYTYSHSTQGSSTKYYSTRR